ncbi:MAG: hypothetical protein NXI08_15865 [bacterium]|nr:hypothetical protein [bacterium]
MNKVLSNIYSSLPVNLQNLGISVFGFYWYRKRFGGVFKKEVEGARKREFFTQEQWNSYQTQCLRTLLVHAFQNVPFYKEKYSAAGLTLSDIKSFELKDLKHLPFLEKDELRKYGTTRLLSQNKSKGSFISSSGSTGTPVSIYLPEYFHQKWNALMETRVRNWAGVTGKTPRGMIGGRRIIPGSKVNFPLYRYNWVEKQTYFSAYHLGPETIHNYIHGLSKNKVEYLTGYAFSIYTMARLAEAQHLSVPQLRAVITSSEKLTSEMRQVIERVFQCKAFDSYSGCEACGLISETPERNLVFSPDSGIMEVIDQDGRLIEQSGEGEVVLTGLHNYDQPLIRYRIGDRVKLSNIQTDERNMPVVKEVIGRIEDVVRGKDGREMVRFHGLYVDVPGLQSAQIVQESLDQIQFNLVIDTGADKLYIENMIRKRLFSQLGDLKVYFNYVDNLPLSPSGKVKAVISHI